MADCFHAHTSRVGYAEAEINRPDAAVAGLAVGTSIRLCTDCKQLVAATSLWGKTGGSPAMVGESYVVLRKPVRAEGGDSR